VNLFILHSISNTSNNGRIMCLFCRIANPIGIGHFVIYRALRWRQFLELSAQYSHNHLEGCSRIGIVRLFTNLSLGKEVPCAAVLLRCIVTSMCMKHEYQSHEAVDGNFRDAKKKAYFMQYHYLPWENSSLVRSSSSPSSPWNSSLCPLPYL
jgi:hypothetical protein